MLHESDLMAYLCMMAPRLVELRRVLKSTGSLYLHCDPTASHYLKVLLDSIFGPACFRNEVIWRYRRTAAPRPGLPHPTPAARLLPPRAPPTPPPCLTFPPPAH